MSWAIPVFRAFGIPVKVHLLFLLVTVGLFLRQSFVLSGFVWWVDILLFTVVLLFGIILLHELGHCFGGRSVGGEAQEILIWPLGGLASVDVPHNPRAHLITVAAGPGVNVVLCVVTAVVMAGAGYLPNLNPFASPYVSEVKSLYRDRLETSEYGHRYYKPGTNEPFNQQLSDDLKNTLLPKVAVERLAETAAREGYERAVAPTWVVWLQRMFWLSWVLFLFNLLPAYPLDGGQLLQGVIWARTGNYRQGTTVAAYSGFVVAVLFLVAAIAFNESLLMGLGLFMFYMAAMKLHSMDAEEGLYGDFSQGYLSLERDDPPPPRPRRQNPIKRWLQARAARRVQREAEQRQREDERMDQLLDKIAKFGKDALTDEEKRFMERVSARYRNK